MTNPLIPALVIPAELKPADGRFGSGPARIRPAQLAALAGAGGAHLGTSPRQPAGRAPVRRILGRLAVPAGPARRLAGPCAHLHAELRSRLVVLRVRAKPV